MSCQPRRLRLRLRSLPARRPSGEASRAGTSSPARIWRRKLLPQPRRRRVIRSRVRTCPMGCGYTLTSGRTAPYAPRRAGPPPRGRPTASAVAVTASAVAVRVDAAAADPSRVPELCPRPGLTARLALPIALRRLLPARLAAPLREEPPPPPHIGIRSGSSWAAPAARASTSLLPVASAAAAARHSERQPAPRIG